ncbi:MarR family transcriptional regulator [Planococcus maritimus]|uniref:MarR family transcriptional regulator n=1 Tax=Planococcus maritimus TaxID=192421 RepID=UPI003138CA86
MEANNLFNLIHTVEAVTNESIILWNDAFPHNVGISPILVLGELERNGAQNQMKLAELLGFSGGAMTNIAGKLVKTGLAVRRSNEEDRRQVLLEITEEGAKVLSEAQALGQKQHLELFDALDADEIAQYLAINEKILNSLKEKRANREKESQ